VYPCILKECRISSGGKAVHLIESDSQLRIAIGTLTMLGIRFVLQEAIRKTEEYVCHSMVKNGIHLKSIIFKVNLPNELHIKSGSMGGELTCLDVSPIYEVYRVLHYTGFACVNFKMTDTGIKIFEINPRMGGSLVENEECLKEMVTKFKLEILK